MFKTPLHLCSLSLMANYSSSLDTRPLLGVSFGVLGLFCFGWSLKKKAKLCSMSSNLKPFFLHFTFLTKTFCVYQTCSWNSTFAQVDFCFPKVQLLPHFLCWEPFARMSLRSGRSKMTRKKTKRESFVNCSNNSNANIFLPSLAEDAMPPTEFGLADYALLLFPQL